MKSSQSISQFLFSTLKAVEDRVGAACWPAYTHLTIVTLYIELCKSLYFQNWASASGRVHLLNPGQLVEHIRSFAIQYFQLLPHDPLLTNTPYVSVRGRRPDTF